MTDNSHIPTNVTITSNQKQGNCPDMPNNFTRRKPKKEVKDPTTPCHFEEFSPESFFKEHVNANGAQTGRCMPFNPPATQFRF